MEVGREGGRDRGREGEREGGSEGEKKHKTREHGENRRKPKKKKVCAYYVSACTGAYANTDLR